MAFWLQYAIKCQTPLFCDMFNCFFLSSASIRQTRLFELGRYHGYHYFEHMFTLRESFYMIPYSYISSWKSSIIYQTV